MKQATMQTDPDVKIPAAVKAAAARSEELFNTLRDTPAPEQDNADEVTSEGNPELNPELKAESLTANPIDDSKTPETDTRKTEARKTETQTDPDDESWEHKYKSIHGRYVRSQESIRQLTEQVRGLQEIVASMKAAPPPANQAGSDGIPELDAENLITDDERADYGEDFLKVVGKRARQEVAPVINAYKAEIAQLKQQLEGFTGFVKQDSQQKLLTRLDEKLPNWREVNTNQEFLDWLSLPDPYSGAIRHDMLKAAYAQGDAHRVLAFFNGFLAEEAAVAPATSEPDASVTKVPKVPLEKLAAPGRAKTAAASPAPAEKPFITRAQVAAFYAEVASGKYRGRDDAKNKAEAEIFAAQREGRIR
jgi:hypothetical protein